MTTNKNQQMEEFIKYIARVKLYNPNFEITERNLYGEFTRIGLNEEERNYDVSSNFNYWIEQFKDVDNIEVFNTEKWKYFCQFENYDEKDINRTQLKIYIPLNKDFIRDGASMIFKYMADNNIKHSSKIGSCIRNDDVVIRVFDKEDANKIMDFIDSNPVIKNNLQPVNPFFPTDGNMGFATDGRLSYSSQFTSCIVDYFNSFNYLIQFDNYGNIIRESYANYQNALKNVNFENFKEFVKFEYNKVFVEHDPSWTKYYEEIRTFDQINNYDKIRKMADANMVMKLIISHLTKEHCLEDVSIIMDQLNNNDYMSKVENEIIDGYDKNNQEKLGDTDPIEIKVDENRKKLLDSVIYTCVRKYGFNNFKNNFEEYLKTGNEKLITRDNGARDIIKTFTKEEVQNIINLTTGNIDMYMNQAMQNKTISIKESVLENACSMTCLKHGKAQLRFALEKAINENDYRAFTNDSGARTNLINNVLSTEILPLIQDILQSNNYSLQGDILEAYSNLIAYNIATKENNIAM